jgi:hypothetical protein
MVFYWNAFEFKNKKILKKYKVEASNICLA